MKQSTVESIVKINTDFYQKVSPIWNNDKFYFWDGWGKIDIFRTSFLTQNNFKVLDLGCGNGRFAHFISSKQNLNLQTFHQKTKDFSKLFYTGLDFSEFWLDLAKKNEPENIATDFFWQDLTQIPYISIQSKKFNLITAFGLFHHLPQKQKRLEIFEYLANLLSPGGVLVWTAWQFWKVSRLQKRVVYPNTLKLSSALSDQLKQFLETEFSLDLQDLESGDAILDWIKKVTAYRFAHAFFDDELAEIETILSQNNLKLIQQFESDGKLNCRNLYLVYIKTQKN